MAIPISKPNLVDQDNPTNPQANGYGGVGIQGSGVNAPTLQGSNVKIQGPKNPKPMVKKVMVNKVKPNLTSRLNKIIGGK